MIEILSGPERKRRRTPQEKIAIVQQTLKPGMTVSHVARLHGVNANHVFTWRRQYQNGSLTAVSAGEDVVPASELIAAMKQIKELQRLLGKKTMEVELLKEAVEDQLGALGLVTNAVVLWHTIYMQAVLAHLRAQGETLNDEDIARLSPLCHGHINMLGHYSFTLAELVTKGHLRPLKEASEAENVA
ncbi:hypothetical protein EWM60_03200 [Candidatus Erwinia dacicola]|nr:Tn3 family transposase [Candidatus Erwinia dacicola]NJC99087.1 hypothetical protein [Candidatus Erwinia dacicola]NJD84958.1 hypothetical protein [Candidatus Erwinia dacicola]